MSACIPALELTQFAGGLLDGDRSREIQQHLEACDSCRTAFGRFDLDATLETRPAQNNIGVTLSVETGAFASGGDVTQAAVASAPHEKMARHLPRIEGYRILGVLGQGGMGIVYRAVQTKLNRTVALKVLPAIVGTASPSAVARFRREAIAAARLHHTNIIPIYDFGESRDAYFYAMEMIIGEPLNCLVKRFAEHHAAGATQVSLGRLLPQAPSGLVEETAHPIDSVPSVDPSVSMAAPAAGGRMRTYYLEVARWMADAADALHYAHLQSIIHRDIKPANLILAADGRIMIADFGLAKSAGEESVTMTGSLVGTLRYMSPEQTMAKRARVDHRTDIYSLGATMYELLCFQPAFAGTDDKQIIGSILSREPVLPRKVVQYVPPELETICFKAIEKSADARYATAKDLADDLRRFIHDLPISAKRPGPIRRTIKFVRRRKAFVSAVTAATLLVAATVLWRATEARRRTAQVNGLYESGMFLGLDKRWDESVRDFNKALDINPTHVKSLLGLAWVQLSYFNSLVGNKDFAPLLKADEACRRARAVDPENVAALNSHGIILKKLERYSEAIDTYQMIIKLKPEDTEEAPHYAAAWSNLGMMYALAGELDKAKEHLHRGAELVGRVTSPYAAVAWRNLAAIELQSQDGLAAEHVKTAIACHKDDQPSWVLQARVRLSLDGRIDYEEALEDAKYADKQALENDGHAKRMRALAHLRNKQIEKAVEHALQAIALRDSATLNCLIIAIAEARRNNLAEAREFLAAADTAWPEKLKPPGAVRVTADRGDLWFDSADELLALRAEAEHLLGVERSQP